MDRAGLERLPWRLRYRFGARLASRVRQLGIQLTHRHCRVEFQGPVRIGPGFALDIPDRGSLIVGPAVDFRRGFVCEISAGGQVSIGAGTTFTSHALLQCSTSIEIGAGCSFGLGTQIIDGNHRFRDHAVPFLEQGYDYRPISIGDGAVVLSKCTILNDLGERAVVGAHSLVNRPVPPYCLAVGIPARVVEYFGPPERRPPDCPDGVPEISGDPTPPRTR